MQVGYIVVIKQFVDKIPRTLIRLSDTGREAIQTYREQMRYVLDGLLNAGNDVPQ
ncbi:MAG: transcriptional regulator [Chloroflexota bacterium]